MICRLRRGVVLPPRRERWKRRVVDERQHLLELRDLEDGGVELRMPYSDPPELTIDPLE